MTAESHSKLLGYFLLIHSILLTIAIIAGSFYLKDEIINLFYSETTEVGQMVMAIFVLFIIIVGICFGLMAVIAIVLQLLSGFTLLVKNRAARGWGIAGTISAIYCFPLGTIIGIYGLWFLLSEKKLYFKNV